MVCSCPKERNALLSDYERIRTHILQMTENSLSKKTHSLANPVPKTVLLILLKMTSFKINTGMFN